MFHNEISKEQAKDAGMAFTLILLLVSYFSSPSPILLAALVLLVLSMSVPVIFRFPAKLWFGASHYLGSFVSRIVLSIIFFFIATPVGFIRKLSGADPMRIKKWQGTDASVFVDRNHTFSKDDLEKPY